METKLNRDELRRILNQAYAFAGKNGILNYEPCDEVEFFKLVDTEGDMEITLKYEGAVMTNSQLIAEDTEGTPHFFTPLVSIAPRELL